MYQNLITQNKNKIANLSGCGSTCLISAFVLGLLRRVGGLRPSLELRHAVLAAMCIIDFKQALSILFILFTLLSLPSGSFSQEEELQETAVPSIQTEKAEEETGEQKMDESEAQDGSDASQKESSTESADSAQSSENAETAESAPQSQPNESSEPIESVESKSDIKNTFTTNASTEETPSASSENKEPISTQVTPSTQETSASEASAAESTIQNASQQETDLESSENKASQQIPSPEHSTSTDINTVQVDTSNHKIEVENQTNATTSSTQTQSAITIHIEAPQEGAVTDSTDIEVKLNVTPSLTQTAESPLSNPSTQSTEPAQPDPSSQSDLSTTQSSPLIDPNQGIKIHLFIDNQPPLLIDDFSKPIPLSKLDEGGHLLRVLAVNEEGRMIPSSFIARRFFVKKKDFKNRIDPNTPYLTLNSPTDGPIVTDSENPFYLEWIVHHGSMGPSGNVRVRYTLDGKSTLLQEPEPVALDHLPSGPHRLIVELIDSSGNSILGPFNNVERNFEILRVLPPLAPENPSDTLNETIPEG